MCGEKERKRGGGERERETEKIRERARERGRGRVTRESYLVYERATLREGMIHRCVCLCPLLLSKKQKTAESDVKIPSREGVRRSEEALVCDFPTKHPSSDGKKCRYGVLCVYVVCNSKISSGSDTRTRAHTHP